MSSHGDFVTTEEAARLLGVSVQHLRRLADAGAVTRLARGVVDRHSIDRYLAANPTSRTRAWAEHTAWGAIAMLAGTYPDWLGPAQASRLRSDLRQIADPGDLIARTRGRAVVRTYTGHRSAIGMLPERLVIPDMTILGLTAATGERVDGYLSVSSFEYVTDSFHLREDPDGSVTLRVTGFPIAIVEELAAEVTLTALDAATSTDPRTRGLGERALSATLDAYRR
ncbi:MAG: hypothetical protein JWO76_1223 [Nocardioides sp.]|nr:hypothetical protein [Nocardioides sp.]